MANAARYKAEFLVYLLMNFYINCILICLIICFISCSDNKLQNTHLITSKLIELNPDQYPDNPDSEIKHSLYESIKYDRIEFQALNDSTFNITLVPESSDDTITLASINLMEYLPTINCSIKKNKYASYIDIINQEWNRNQVQFNKSEFVIKSLNANNIVRLDIARNCLNAYLWEVILFADFRGEQKPIYHGWFNFPKELYASLFELRNNTKYTEYQKPLEEWVDIESKPIDLNLLRIVKDEREVYFENFNMQPYSLKGERKKKFKNIIYPVNTTIMQSFLTDSTLFATFSPPGIYNKSDPRKTELSRLANLNKIIARKTIASYYSSDTLIELEMIFNAGSVEKQTHFFISGLQKNEIPVLDTSEVEKGWQNSMGIGNHTFYETYKNSQSHSSLNSPYFALLTDIEGKWLDSHKIGIDGPLLYWDIKDKRKLHVLILSFERHAFVSHYLVSLN